ncbi:unnamed protein product [Arctia plantaginis]|uniref:Uncharacterized protein n=1 Tax=Arctia plantaginis TaxID=874455 RepID=A0A8S1B556_ARCPL|nr:unnamed protein product [Arctia plantaginis]
MANTNREISWKTSEPRNKHSSAHPPSRSNHLEKIGNTLYSTHKNAKCSVLKNVISRQMEQAESKKTKKEERIKRSVVRLGAKYADITIQGIFKSATKLSLSQTRDLLPDADTNTLMMLMDTMNRMIHSHLNNYDSKKIQ